MPARRSVRYTPRTAQGSRPNSASGATPPRSRLDDGRSVVDLDGVPARYTKKAPPVPRCIIAAALTGADTDSAWDAHDHHLCVCPPAPPPPAEPAGDEGS